MFDFLGYEFQYVGDGLYIFFFCFFAFTRITARLTELNPPLIQEINTSTGTGQNSTLYTNQIFYYEVAIGIKKIEGLTIDELVKSRIEAMFLNHHEGHEEHEVENIIYFFVPS